MTLRQQLRAATLPLAHSGIQIVQQLRAATLLQYMYDTAAAATAATLPQYDTAAAATGCNIAAD